MPAELATRIRVTLTTKRIGPPSLDERDRLVLDALAGGEALLTSEIAKIINFTPRATRTPLARLVDQGH